MYTLVSKCKNYKIKGRKKNNRNKMDWKCGSSSRGALQAQSPEFENPSLQKKNRRVNVAFHLFDTECSYTYSYLIFKIALSGSQLLSPFYSRWQNTNTYTYTPKLRKLGFRMVK
jgi:hypothetical protein